MENIQKSYPRDVFMHLLNTIALYVSTFSVLSLVFDYINAAFPDPLNPYYDAGMAIRFPLAVFIIIFGVFIWTARFIEKDLVKNLPEHDIHIAHHWLILHGRYVCVARSPKCDVCEITYMCRYFERLTAQNERDKLKA